MSKFITLIVYFGRNIYYTVFVRFVSTTCLTVCAHKRARSWWMNIHAQSAAAAAAAEQYSVVVIYMPATFPMGVVDAVDKLCDLNNKKQMNDDARRSVFFGWLGRSATHFGPKRNE